MAVTVDQFGKAIVAAGLLPAAEVKALWARFPSGARPKDSDTFAKLLVQQGTLTAFQSQELLSGSHTPLVLGDYVLLDKIGAGGMGQVFKAEHRHMKRLVAIKLLPTALTKDEAVVKRFQREVQAAAKLSHPNIVHANDAGVQRGVWYLVMEYVEGRDLSAILKQRGPLPVAQAVECVLQAARGLAYAHGQGVIHRDIKPANLLLGKDGVVKILDMGLARFDSSGDAADHQLTNTGQVMGTVDYMAPEQAASTHDADARSDIYSLGCALFRLLTGENVYDEDTVVKKILAHVGAPIPSLRQKRGDVPAEIDRIFQKMVAKKPADRYQQTTQLVGDLEAWSRAASTSQLSQAPLAKPDGKLADFLRGTGTPKTTTTTANRAVTVALEQTVSLAHQEVETDPHSKSVLPSVRAANTRPPAKRMPVSGKCGAGKPPVKLVAGAIGGLVLCLWLGVWVIIRDKDGNEVARIQVPEGGTATVQTTPAQPAIVPKPRSDNAAVPAPQPSAPAFSPPAATSSPFTLPGFVPLFNGQDLTGWKGAVADPKRRALMSPAELAAAQAEADKRMLAHWHVEDGVLVFDGQGDNLCTIKDYTDFELYLQWKISVGGDTGVYLRGAPQVQIWDSTAKPTGENMGSGGLYNNLKHPKRPLVNADKPVGEWNAMYIRMVGEKVTVRLNEQLVVDDVVFENQVERDQPIYASGPIELQKFGTPLHFRNLLIRELKPTAPTATKGPPGQLKTRP